MKFKKFGKALLMTALSAGLILSVTSCIEDYSVGYLYVTGNITAQPTGSGIISGFKIGHNTGNLANINGLPISSGGANPGRAVLVDGSKFLYVLNRGVNSLGNANCYGTGANECQNSNIVEFAVGGNGILTPQETFFTQGNNPFRIVADSSGNYLYVLDHDSPSNAACTAALGTPGPCGDVTAFQINQSTGRLTLIVNAQVSAASGGALPYFPVPANPIDFVFASSYILTLSGTPATGDFVYPYTYSSSSGQLTVSQNSSQPLNIAQATAIVDAGGDIYVLDNESISISFNGTTTTSASQILPWTIGSGGALQAATGGIVPDDPTLANPYYLLVESKGKFVYVLNQGNNVQGVNAQSGIAAYFITSSPSFYLSFIPGEPFGTGGGPQCLVEDPSDQFIYSADFNDSIVNGRTLDPNSGVLNPLRTNKSYPLEGPAAWCLIDGRTG
jgi:6-phosphogluconolactonase